MTFLWRARFAENFRAGQRGPTIFMNPINKAILPSLQLYFHFKIDINLSFLLLFLKTDSLETVGEDSLQFFADMRKSSSATFALPPLRSLNFKENLQRELFCLIMGREVPFHFSGTKEIALIPNLTHHLWPKYSDNEQHSYSKLKKLFSYSWI